MDILIVDDELPALRQMEGVLKNVVPDAVVEKANRADKALAVFREGAFDVVFLDIRMPGKDGLELAREFEEIKPDINIIMVTAYPQFALDAYSLYVSDYIVKPAMEQDVRDALEHLRNTVSERMKGLYVQCFGCFEVLYDGKPVRFRRSKAKELFACMIDRRGTSATNAWLRAELWRDEVRDERKQRQYFSQFARDLRVKLEELGCGDVLVWERDSYAVVPEKIPCDYYRALQGDSEARSHFHGEYMSQYEWAEERIGVVKRELEM